MPLHGMKAIVVRFALAGLLWTLTTAHAAPQTAAPATDDRPLRALFLGDRGHHKPAERFRQLEPAMSFRGITLVYTERMADLNPATLAGYDALVVYANIVEITPEQEKAVLDFVAGGKGYVPLHCASYCFLKSDKLIALTGAQFKSHGTGIFRTRTAEAGHEVMKDFTSFESWDETYVHHRHNAQERTVLEYRDKEPWTWVRTHGKGRVFYTAWGHDERTWGHVGFQELVERGIRWASGRAVYTHKNEPVRGLKPFQYGPAKDRIPNYVAGAKWGAQNNATSQMQLPLPAAESARHLVLPNGFEAKLFAAEPDIRRPLAMAWDERGRLWVCESINYPNDIRAEGNGSDTIRVCEDTDGDGRADKFTVFAEGLNIPTSLTFWQGGVIVHQAPHTLYLKDTDGDGKADVRKVLLNGWSKGDTHAGPSNLVYGFDNWIWGTVGYAGFNGEIGGEPRRFATGFYRFRPDGSKLEFLRNNNNNCWGLGFSEEGIVFGSTANRNPSVYLPIPNRYYEAVRGWNSSVLGASADTHLFHALSDKVRQVDHHGGYTAAAGHALYTARAWPSEYWNRTAFVAEPTGKLIGTFFLEREGADFRTRNPVNLLASDDEWTAPIMAEVGPDGHIWVIDWYNYIVQHNPTPIGFKNGRGNAYETALRETTLGRVYRVVYKHAPPAAAFHLGDASPAKLVAALGHDNLFWRRHAQRLLVERGPSPETRTALLALARDQRLDAIGLNPGVIHALWTLHGWGALDGRDAAALQVALTALRHPSAGVRRNALQVLPATTTVAAAILDGGLLNDPDAQVRLAAFLALADQSSNEAAGAAIYQALQRPENANDRWLPEAATAAAARHDAGFLRAALGNSEATGKPQAPKPAPKQNNLVANPSMEEMGNGAPVSWRRLTHNGEATFSVDDQSAHGGKRSVKITSQTGADVSWSQDIAVKPRTRYRVSAWVKTRGLKAGTGEGAQINLHELQRQGKTSALKGDTDWARITSEFETGTHTKLILNLLYGGWGRSTGEAWWDDVEVFEVGPATGAAADGLPDKIGQTVGIVTRHYAQRAPVESVVATLGSLRSANEELAAFVLDGLINGWPANAAPKLTETDRAELSALMKALPAGQKDRLLSLAARWGRADIFAADAEAVIKGMRVQLTNSALPADQRGDAARRLLRLEDQPATVAAILDTITVQTPSDLASALVSALGESRSEQAGPALLAKWTTLTPATRRAGITVLLRRPPWTRALLQSIEQGKVLRGELNAAEWQSIKISSDAKIAELAKQLDALRGDADRQVVLKKMLPWIEQPGDVARGAEVFKLLCVQCHSLGGQGGLIGPDLTGIGARPAPEILAEIVDPNRSLESNFRLWTLELKNDDSISGRLDGESRTSVELLDLTGKRHVAQRQDIKSLTASSLSIMPVGLIDGLPPKDVASLLAFLSASKEPHKK